MTARCILHYPAILLSVLLTIGGTAAVGILFRGDYPSLGRITFSHSEFDYYGGGARAYIAHFSRPIGQQLLTFIVVHCQTDYNGGRCGVLSHYHVHVPNPSLHELHGTIDFSKVYDVLAPAGAPPFGTYTLSIRAGATDRAPLIARGSFTVTQDDLIN